MKYLLLAIIYLTFISLGLPDSVFGAAWPVAYVELGVSQGLGSMYSVVTGITSGLMSFFAGKLISKLGTGKVTLLSISLTVIGLIAMSFAPNIYVLLLCAAIMGAGAGAIDTGLNSYVSRHYNAMHMNWLHGFWGVGVTISPMIMSVFLGAGEWRKGYLILGLIQLGIAIFVACSQPLWKRVGDVEAVVDDDGRTKEKKSFLAIMKTEGMIPSILSLGFYCSIEWPLIVWLASYLVNANGYLPEVAARYASAFFFGIMLGRIIAGFVALKVCDNWLVRAGSGIALAGIILLSLRMGYGVTLVGVILTGLGFGPIFPSIIHSVPSRFGEAHSAEITGYHMGTAYAMGFGVQFAFGFVADATTYVFLPYMALVFLPLCVVMAELAVYRTKRNNVI